MWLFPLMTSLLFAQSMYLGPCLAENGNLTADHTLSIHPATTEYDDVLENWQKGKELSLTHYLFRLNRVDAGSGVAHQIVFTGEGSGEAGEITLTFYTLDGDIVHVPPNHIHNAHVDATRRKFSVAAIVPAYLRKRTGAVQITFNGSKRAAFLVKVHF